MTKAVDLLVDCHPSGEARSAKALKADKLGVEVWSEQQWMELVAKYSK